MDARQPYVNIAQYFSYTVLSTLTHLSASVNNNNIRHLSKDSKGKEEAAQVRGEVALVACAHIPPA